VETRSTEALNSEVQGDAGGSESERECAVRERGASSGLKLGWS